MKSENPENQLRTRGFGLRREILPVLAENYKSSLVEEMQSHGYSCARGRLTFKLAREFGFCYGVEKAIDFAYETRVKFPDRNIYITSEIIHNPLVNRKLVEMGVRFLSGPYKTDKGAEDIGEGDIVLLPAFGTTVKELEFLKTKNCLLVDSTCNSVVAVWRRVEQYASDGFTSVIHGKFDHEETKATSSRAGKFIIVWDKAEAQIVCDYIAGRGQRKAFMNRFARAVSGGFDPDRDLSRLGCANQTTMMSSESLEIAGLIQKAMAGRYGEAHLAEHFRHFDTICSATQERQDAMVQLLGREKVDVMIVIGGFNSSNTTHLAEIAASFGIPNYHVKDADCILSAERIEHKPIGSAKSAVTSGWLPPGPVTIGVTAGASTPNRVIEDVIERIAAAAGDGA